MENVMTVVKGSMSVNVSRAALLARINYRIKKRGLRLYASMSKEAVANLGRFHILNSDKELVSTHVDPEAYARELGVLRPFEIAVGF